MEPIFDPREQRREWREQRRQWRQEKREWRRQHSGIIPGMVLVGVGALFFLNNLHIVFLREWLQYWPVILIAIGIVKLVDSTETGGRAAGGILTGVGAVWLAKNLGYVEFRWRDMWPLVLVAIGALMLFERAAFVWNVKANAEFADPSKRGSTSNQLHLSAVFSGGKRKVVAQDFEGGTISAVFGGYEINLRGADIAGEQAVLQIDTVFGGAEIKIPEHWRAEVRGTGVFGAFTDETTPPDSVHYPNPKRLIVKGAAVFGGVVVKN
jgi:hypothetical protein